MEQNRQNHAGHDQIRDTELRGDVQAAKLVVLLIVGRDEWTEQTIQSQTHTRKTGELHEVVEPVAGLVEGQVALVPHDGEQADDEGERVELKSLHRHALGRLGAPHAEVQHADAEAAHERGVGL